MARAELREGTPVPKQRASRISLSTVTFSETTANSSSGVCTPAGCTSPTTEVSCEGERQGKQSCNNVCCPKVRPSITSKPLPSPASTDENPNHRQMNHASIVQRKPKSISFAPEVSSQPNGVGTAIHSRPSPAQETLQQRCRVARTPASATRQKSLSSVHSVDESTDKDGQSECVSNSRTKLKTISFAQDTRGQTNDSQRPVQSKAAPYPSSTSQQGCRASTLQPSAPKPRKRSLPTAALTAADEDSQPLPDRASTLYRTPPNRASAFTADEENQLAYENLFERRSSEQEDEVYTQIDDHTYSSVDYDQLKPVMKDPREKTTSTMQSKRKGPPRPPPPFSTTKAAASARKASTLAADVQPSQTMSLQKTKPPKPNRPPPSPPQSQTQTSVYVNVQAVQSTGKGPDARRANQSAAVAQVQPTSKANETGYMTVPLLPADSPTPTLQRQKPILPRLPLLPPPLKEDLPRDEHVYGQLWYNPDDEGDSSPKTIYQLPRNDPLVDTSHFGQFVTTRRKPLDDETGYVYDDTILPPSSNTTEETTYVNLEPEHDYCYAIPTGPVENTQNPSPQRSLISLPHTIPAVQPVGKAQRSVQRVPMARRSKLTAVAH